MNPKQEKQILTDVELATQAMKSARRERNLAIARALEAGIKRAHVAEAAGLHRVTIHAIHREILQEQNNDLDS